MDDCSEFVLKKLCCTCLSRDRKLSQLCRSKEGIDNLYFLLLSHYMEDTDTYRESFLKNAASWYICWECWAIMTRITKFRAQACVAQRQLLDIVEGRTDFKLLKACLSHLTVTQTPSSDLNIIKQDIDNFIDCSVNIKTESEEDTQTPLSLLHNISVTNDRINPDEEDYKVDTKMESEEDTPLSLLHYTSNTDDHVKSDEENYEEVIQPQIVEIESETLSEKKVKKPPVIIKKNKVLYIKASNENKLSGVKNKPYVCTEDRTNFELDKEGTKLKLNAVFARKQFKCESCVEVFNSKPYLDYHISQIHTKSVREKPISNQLGNLTILDERAPDGSGCKKPAPREKCPVCDKIVRVDSMKRHALTHHSMMKDRCWCVMCGKYYRSLGELKTHVNYNHTRETEPKCHICGRELASRISLKRHIMYVHEGVEKKKDKQ